MPSYKKVDITNWERKMHYSIFKEYAQPQYNISFELDITKFYERVKRNHWSFTLAMIYAYITIFNTSSSFLCRWYTYGEAS